MANELTFLRADNLFEMMTNQNRRFLMSGLFPVVEPSMSASAYGDGTSYRFVIGSGILTGPGDMMIGVSEVV